ncbi:MAG: hypothetical protein AAF804_08080, partial [Bacteroidota bacterium]
RINFTGLGRGQIFDSEVSPFLQPLDPSEPSGLVQNLSSEQPWGSFWGYTTQEISNGGYALVDKNEDGQITEADQGLIGPSLPRWYGAWTSHLSYQNWTLSWIWQAAGGHQVLNLARQENLVSNQGVIRALADAENLTPMQLVPNGIHDQLLEDASFLRLQQVSLSYRPDFLPKMKVSLVGENLWILSQYQGYDPWVNSMGQNSMNLQGLDAWAYPRARTVLVQVSYQW